MAANNNTRKVFRAQRKEFTMGATLVSSRQAVNKSTGERFDVAIFDDGAEVLMPNGWYPIGFDICFGEKYAAGWDDEGKFHFDPVVEQ